MLNRFQKGGQVAERQSQFGGFKRFQLPQRQPAPRSDIRESDTYKNAVSNAQRYADEAKRASSFWGMAGNFAKAVPRATADVLIGTPFKFGASIAEIPGIVARGGQTSQREYKIPGLSPFKSYQSDFENVAGDVIEGRKGLGSVAWSVAQPVLGGLEMLGISKGLGKGLSAYKSAPNVLKGLRAAAPEVVDAFVPTTRGISRADKTQKYLDDLKVAKNKFDLEKSAKMQGVDFFDDEMNSQYEAFKKLYGLFGKGKTREAFESMDVQAIKNKLGNKVAPELIDNILYSQSKKDDEVLDSFMTMLDREKAAKGMKFEPPKFEATPEEIAKMNLPETPQTVKIKETIPQKSKYLKSFRSGQRELENQGLAGQELLKRIQDEQIAADLQTGRWKSLVKQFTQRLNNEQKVNLTDVLEGKANPIDAQVAASSKVMRNLLNKIQRTAKQTGLDVGYRENYFPRKYNWSEMIKTGRKEEIYQHMVDTGQASTKAEAEQFFKDFITKNTERKAGNLEYERMFDIPGYEKDPEKALTMYVESAAKRISEVKAFGKKDEIPSALINKIAEGGGDYREAQKIFDYVYKGEPKNELAKYLLGYNAFSKLSMAFFSNLTQSVNTAAKAGLLNTIKGASQALAQGVRAIRKQDYNDLTVLANAMDEHINLQETGLSNRFIKGAMYLFQKIENFNRRTATYAGAYRAKDLAKVLESDPGSAFAARQLKSLGIDAVDVIGGKLTEKQLLTAANKMARATQFKIDALNLPTMWRTPLGKLLTQFKSFSFMQTRFIRDEILKEAKYGNLAPLARFLILAPIASYVTQSTRNWVNAAKQDPNSWRQADLYRKAVGDIPTDIVSQLQYAYSKAKSTYIDKQGREIPKTSLLEDVRNFSSPFIGPTGGDIAELLASLDAVSAEKEKNRIWYANHLAAQSDPYLKLKRFGASKIPYFGRRLTNTTFGFKPTVAKDAKAMAAEALQTGDVELLEQAIQKDPYLFNERVIQNITGKKIKEMSATERKVYEQIKNQKKFGKPFFTP